MDFSSLSINLVKILTPYLLLGGDAYIKEFGKDMYQKTKEFKNWLWKKVKKSNNNHLKRTIEVFDADPKNFDKALEGVLKEYFERHPEFAQECQHKLEKISSQNIGQNNVNIHSAKGVSIGNFNRIDMTFNGDD